MVGICGINRGGVDGAGTSVAGGAAVDGVTSVAGCTSVDGGIDGGGSDAGGAAGGGMAARGGASTVCVWVTGAGTWTTVRVCGAGAACCDAGFSAGGGSASDGPSAPGVVLMLGVGDTGLAVLSLRSATTVPAPAAAITRSVPATTDSGRRYHDNLAMAAGSSCSNSS